MTEVEELRARVAILEAAEKDRRDPNILLIEGLIDRWGGEYSAMGVKTNSGHVYLAEVIEDLMGYSSLGSFQWHVSSEPKSLYELEENLIATAMGKVNTQFDHAYSDLTGYLWTTENVKVGGHDILKEIAQVATTMDEAYLCLRVEKNSK